MQFSNYPLSCLQYFTETHGDLKEVATCRTDQILGVGTIEKTLASLFCDYVSGYSPLSAEVGDTYYVPTTKMLGDFFKIGADE